MNQRAAIQHINKQGILLVFPIDNRKAPLSLWSQFFPRTKMRWEWTDDGDDKVAKLWHLMKKLSCGRQVVYSKWYKGRATYFSREVFCALLSELQRTPNFLTGLSPQAFEILEILQGDSPLSTKELKAHTGLQGKLNEPTYNRAMKQLFSRFLIVAFGEVDDGSFPSLAVGATKLLYEDLWQGALALSKSRAQSIIDQALPPDSDFRKFFDRMIREMQSQNVREHRELE
jgi:hypothetical protein